jgi:hypothetical protein
MKLKRGQKLCTKCNHTNGARSKVCKNCKTQFEIRGDYKNKVHRKKNKNLISVNWKTLSRGDEIYFMGRSGTYTLNSDGDKEYSTDKGVYKVVDIKDNGFVAYGTKGHTFFYMGEEKQSKWLPTIYNAPHKIYIKKRPEIVQVM